MKRETLIWTIVFVLGGLALFYNAVLRPGGMAKQYVREVHQFMLFGWTVHDIGNPRGVCRFTLHVLSSGHEQQRTRYARVDLPRLHGHEFAQVFGGDALRAAADDVLSGGQDAA